MLTSAVGSSGFVAPLAVTVTGLIMPFMTWGSPSGDGIQQTIMYVPGSSVIVPSAVSPGPALFGPPTSVAHAGILRSSPHDFIALLKSAGVLPFASCTIHRWWISLPELVSRKVTVPAGMDDGASNL